MTADGPIRPPTPFRNPFPTAKRRLPPLKAAAAEQQVGGDDEEISFQDEEGHWHFEHTDGGDRPEATVEDG